jgi:hypothetical protein
MEKLIQSGLLLSFAFGIICLIAYGIQKFLGRRKIRKQLEAFYIKMLVDIERAEIRFANEHYVPHWAVGDKNNCISLSVDPNGKPIILIEALHPEYPVVWYMDKCWRFKLEAFTYISKHEPIGIYQHINSGWRDFPAKDEICLNNLTGKQHMDLVRAIYERSWSTLVELQNMESKVSYA